MKDEHLDQIGYLVGEERFQGQKATGKVTFQTSADGIRIYEGTVVGTQPDNDGEFQRFKVDADADGVIQGDEYVTPPDGATEVTVDVIADEVGPEYNVGSGQLTFLPNPPAGVLGVTNQQATANGENVQGNESFREDVKRAVARSSGGGTTAGVKGFIESNVNGVRSGDVIIEEFVEESPPSVDVIVDGGSEQDALDAINNARPAGIKHNLIRPEVQNIGVKMRVVGTDVNTEFVRDKVNNYLLELGMSQNLYRDELISTAMEADEDIINVDRLEAIMASVVIRSVNFYSSQTDYRVASTYPEGGLGRTIEDKLDNVYQKGQDYEEVDITGDGNLDGVRWIGDTPESKSGFEEGLSYYIDYFSRERFEFQSGTTEYITQASPTANTVVVDEDGNEYSSSAYSFQDTDSTGVNDTLVWSDTSSLSDGDVFFVKYGEPQSVNEEIEEEHTYDTTQSVYKLDREIVLSDKDNTVRDETDTIYEQGTDFTYVDSNGDGQKDAIDWSINNTTPADGDKFYVSYKTTTDQIVGNRQKVSPENVQVIVK
jgi:hypothetical protein